MSDTVRIKITPCNITPLVRSLPPRTVFHLEVDGFKSKVDFRTYDDACSIANLIARVAKEKTIVIDFSECIGRTERTK